MKKYKIFKKQGILKNILCVSLSLLVGFVSTYGLFFFSVDSYKYSSEKDTKTYSDVGYENFDVTETNSITRHGKQSTPTSYECFQLGKHTVERVCSGLSPLRRDRLWC